MPVIRQYVSESSAQAGIPTRNANASDFGGDGLSALASGLGGLANGINKYQAVQEETQVHKDMSQALMDWTQKTNESEKNAQPGDMTYAPQLREEMGAYFNKLSENYKTKSGKAMFARLSASTTAQFYGRADAFQVAQAGIAAKQDAFQTRENNTKAVLTDPSKLDLVKAQDEAIIGGGFGNYGHLSINQRNELLKQNREEYAWAASYGAIEKDPAGWLHDSGVVSAANKLNGTQIGGLPSGSTGGFANAVQAVFAKEGGYKATDGNSGNPVNMGINQRANPDIDVKNLTKPQAEQLYKDRYWNPIGGDNLPAPVAMFAFDAAVNMGVPTAKRLLTQSGGDLNKMAELRKQMYKDIATNDPAQAKYLSQWLERTDATLAQASKMTPPPLASQAETNPALLQEVAKANPALADLSPAKLINLIQHAETRQNQAMAVNKAQLEHVWKDQASQAMSTGDVAAPMTRSQFYSAYGKAEGDRRYDGEYKPMLDVGATIKSVVGMPVAQQNATLDALKPVPNSPDFAAAQTRYDTAINAVNTVRQHREQDQIGFGIQQKLKGLAPLDMSSPDAMADGVASRVAAAKAIQTDFGLRALKTLSAPEAAGMRDAFNHMPSSQQMAYLGALQLKVRDPEAFRATISQIAPDSPETQVAAGLVNLGNSMTTERNWFSADTRVAARDAAAIVLEGKQLLNRSADTKANDGKSTGFPMPKDSDMRMEFNNVVGTAFAGNEPAYEASYQSVRAYYAGKAAREGKIDGKEVPDTKLVQEAVQAVTGGVTDFNGRGPVLRPWGMPDDMFQQKVTEAATAAFATAGIQGPAADVRIYRLMGAGDGQYWLVNGTEPVRSPITGEKVLVDVSRKGNDVPIYNSTPTGAKGSRESGGKIKY